jgi:hypothetical protein
MLLAIKHFFMRSFREIATEYCAWVEQSAIPQNVANWLSGILAELIHAVFALPDDGLSDLTAEGFKAKGDLNDDVADIYRDLAEGLFIAHYVSWNEAERYWRHSFRYHWGAHATSALRALYWSQRNKIYGS